MKEGIKDLNCIHVLQEAARALLEGKQDTAKILSSGEDLERLQRWVRTFEFYLPEIKGKIEILVPTPTGRIVDRKPNLENVPVKSRVGARLRGFCWYCGHPKGDHTIGCTRPRKIW